VAAGGLGWAMGRAPTSTKVMAHLGHLADRIPRRGRDRGGCSAYELPMSLPTHILVPFDFSAPSKRALTHALELAATLEAQVSVLHVGPPTTAFLSPFPDLAGLQMDAWTDARARREEQFQERFEQILGELGIEQELQVHYSELEVPRAIAEAVEELECDLVVVGSRDRSAGEQRRTSRHRRGHVPGARAALRSARGAPALIAASTTAR
jgi:nucleotide-binding universal stress UspA family protein